MKPKKISPAMLRAAFAMFECPIPYEGKSFRKAFARKQIFITWRVVDALCRRGLAKMTFRKQHEKGRGWVNYLSGAFLTAAGKRLVRATPQTCAGCGCTDLHACPEGCSWAAPFWCSACDENPERSLADVA